MSDNRTISEKYHYFIRGRQLVIVEKKLSRDENDNVPSYQAPSATLAGGLMLEYTSIPDTSSMVDESDDIPLNDVLSLALVDYIKSVIAEDPNLKEYHMERFNKRVVRYVEGRTGGLRRVLGNPMMRK